MAVETGNWQGTIAGSKTIWTAQTATTVGGGGSLVLSPNSAMELQYISNGQFLPISFTGGGYTVH